MDRFGTRSQRIGPKVHKSLRINTKWGPHYHKAIQDIVFGKQCLPYMPTEPPASLSEEIVESDPLYVCKQCKDCFRFQSSFKDHNTRHSWILGFWCHNCFETLCTHVTETSSIHMKCSACTKKYNEKRAYLRARGLHGKQKLGVIKVFYNQCQFIEHLKMHQLSSVNMSDLMLIPLPIEMSNNDWSFEFEILCEALMERAFLLRIHIIDWFKMYDLKSNWWKLDDGKSQDSTINNIVNTYQARQLFEQCDTSTANANFNSSNDVHNVNENSLDVEFINSSLDKNTNNCSANVTSDKNVLENEDNPCVSNDITFVDCGPTSQYFEPEISMNHKEHEINCCLVNTARINTKNKTFKDNLICHNEIDIIPKNAATVETGDNDTYKNTIIKQLNDYMQRYKNIEPFVKKTAENNPSRTDKILSNPINIPLSAKKNAMTKINLDHPEQSLQTPRTIGNSKVLAIQDPKNMTAIVNQLSPHLVSNKRVVVKIEQDSHNENNITRKDANIRVVDNSRTNSNMLIQKKRNSNFKKQVVNGEIIVSNGTKYLVKYAKSIPKNSKKSSNLSIARNATKQPISEHNTLKSKLMSTNSNEIEIIGIEQTASVHNNVPLLTPSPSVSEILSNSNCELLVNKTSIMPKLQEMPPHLVSMPMHQTERYIMETISLIKEENGDFYMDIKDINRISKESFRDVCNVIMKYKREMFEEYRQMNSLQLKERVDHLQCVSEEMREVLNFVSEVVVRGKLKTINTHLRKLKECFTNYNQDVEDKESNDVILNEWETKVDSVHKCPSCNKSMKPKSYIIGFSKLSKNDNAYCSCYKKVCHLCISYQGSVAQFIAHQNIHKKSEPYICPDCHLKFNSTTTLEAHMWTVCFHTLRKITFTCKICEIDGFRDIESITRHFVIMHSKTKIGCEDCLRVFLSYNEYVQHCTETHPSKTEQNPVRLVICKLSNVILRCENYMSYLDKYPAVRKLIWFKCPFCHLITTNNKYATTLLNKHIRDNHAESLAKVVSKETFTKILDKQFSEAKEGFPQQFSKTVSSKNNDNTIANKMPCMDDVMVPKIVNTRTISSEIFEHGSQDTEYMWSTDTNEVVNENPQTTKETDDKKKRDLLPKIIDIRGWIEDGSIDNLKPSKPQEVNTKFLTKPQNKSNSSSCQIKNKTKDEKLVLFAHEGNLVVAMELNDNKSSSNENTAKTKEFDKDNNELTTNALYIPESEKPVLGNAVDMCVDSPIESIKKVPEKSMDNHIRIVDFRKICKPDIEQFVAAETCDIQIKDDNASYTTSISKPPPLARIPQYLLEPVEPVEVNKSENELTNDSKLKSKKSSVRRTAKSKVRIALGLGTDTQKEESIDYLCHLCNERINTSSFVIQTHFREKHSDQYKVAVITPQLPRMSSDFINGGYKRFLNNKKRKSDSALFASKRKRRWTQKRYTDIKDSNPVGLCVEQETAEDDEGNFICKKCDHRCTDISRLREHIAANHRLKDRYLICLECGENFVVAPSLQMHLKAFHGIEDPINYMSQNPSYAPDDSNLQAGGRTTVANQCYVCMAVFEDKAAVDKHLRVHGMAFLNRKRIEAKNALEKKTNTEEDKPNITKSSEKIAKQDKPAETILEKINAVI